MFFYQIQLTVTIFDIQTKHNESVQQWLGPNCNSGIMQLILAARAHVHSLKICISSSIDS